jgi:hypothetical protein
MKKVGEASDLPVGKSVEFFCISCLRKVEPGDDTIDVV